MGFDMSRRKTDVFTINRGAVILEPTEEYLRWAQNAPDPMPDLTLEKVRGEPHVYLMPMYELDSDAEEWLQANYEDLFQEELYAWCTNSDYWPADLSYEGFRKFFKVYITSMIFDMGKGSIRRDA